MSVSDLEFEFLQSQTSFTDPASLNDLRRMYYEDQTSLSGLSVQDLRMAFFSQDTPDPDPVEILFDSFDRADTSGLGDTPFPYVTDTGWIIQDNSAIMTSVDDSNTFAIAEPGATDYQVYGRMLPAVNDVRTYLVARYSSWTDVIYGGRRYVAEGQYEAVISVLIDNVETVVATAPISSFDVVSDWVLIVNGNDVSLKQDDVELISPTALPAGSPTGTYAGLATYLDNGFEEWGVYTIGGGN